MLDNNSSPDKIACAKIIIDEIVETYAKPIVHQPAEGGITTFNEDPELSDEAMEARKELM